MHELFFMLSFCRAEEPGNVKDFLKSSNIHTPGEHYIMRSKFDKTSKTWNPEN